MFHSFRTLVDRSSLPGKFTNPFQYEPHPLCIEAVGEVVSFLETREQWTEELRKGKMFGVLVVESEEGETGFLSAYSGNLEQNTDYSYFVPPVFDLLDKDNFFLTEESEITSINNEIYNMEESGRYRDLEKKLYDLQNDFRIQFVRMKLQAKESKAERDKRRKENIPEYEMSEMIRESQFQKAELKRFERQKLSEINAVKEELSVCEDMIPALKEKRKTLSIGLQKKIFDHYIVHSAKGNSISLTDLFGQSTGQLPPSGAGECAAPKLLQYAFKNKLKPVVMAEFWYGDSPKNELRRHGCYYPACKSKCEPILKFMLQGLIIEDALSVYDKAVAKLEIIFEDEYLFVVNKPQGLLSVKGKKKYDTVISKVREQTNYTGDLFIVHRLDMDTSGLMALAKAKSVYKALQKQFLDRKVEKCYVALLDGIVKEKEGEINLPLCPDPENRPRQIVNYELGKKAKTIFKVIEEKDNKTRIEFYPVTGRTHQLRVHAAHPDGLNTPVSGDRLYGCPSDRMYLHAQSLMFDHPVTAKRLCFVKKASF